MTAEDDEVGAADPADRQAGSTDPADGQAGAAYPADRVAGSENPAERNPGSTTPAESPDGGAARTLGASDAPDAIRTCASGRASTLLPFSRRCGVFVDWSLGWARSATGKGQPTASQSGAVESVKTGVEHDRAGVDNDIGTDETDSATNEEGGRG